MGFGCGVNITEKVGETPTRFEIIKCMFEKFTIVNYDMTVNENINL